MHGELQILREVSLPGKVDLKSRLLHPGFLGTFDIKSRRIAPPKEYLSASRAACRADLSHTGFSGIIVLRAATQGP